MKFEPVFGSGQLAASPRTSEPYETHGCAAVVVQNLCQYFIDVLDESNALLCRIPPWRRAVVGIQDPTRYVVFKDPGVGSVADANVTGPAVLAARWDGTGHVGSIDQPGGAL